MSISDRQIKFYADSMIVEALLCNNTLSKTAEGGFSQLIDAIKNYVSKKIDPNDREGSFLNLFAPGIIVTTLRSFGMPWIGLFLGLSVSIFHINVANIFRSIWSELKGLLNGGKKVNPAQVDSIVHTSVSEESNDPVTPEQAENASVQLKHSSMSDIRITKLAMVQLDLINKGIVKDAGILDWFKNKKAKQANLLSQVLGWIFKVALTSAGLMVGTAVIEHILNKSKDPNVDSSTLPVHQTTQTKFPLQPSYHEEQKNNGTAWTENIANDSASIGQMLLNFSKQVYQGLDGLDSIIESCPNFQSIQNRLTYYNKASEGDHVVFIPRFTSKKHIVDYFIDDVAQKAK